MRSFNILSLMLILSFCSTLHSQAYDFTVDGVYYTVTSMTDLTCEVTSGDAKYEGRVQIPAFVSYNGRTLSVTSVGDKAFYNCSALTSVTIPSNVLAIGTSAFASCTKLASVTFPYSLVNIGDEAFYRCSELTSVNIPNSVISVGKGAFRNCI